jgi:RNA methyltransferase, TrmH family
MKLIQSRDNPVFKHLRALVEDARYRREQAASLLDGDHLLRAALDAGIAPRRVVLGARAKAQELVTALLERLPPSCELLELSDALLRQLSPVETPSGILAEIAVPVPAAVSFEGATGDILLLEGVQDAGNLGTLLRTAAAAGVQQVFLSAQCAQAWSPKVLRAGMGAHFALQIHEHVALGELLSQWPGEILATALDVRAENLFAIDLRPALAWMFGSEGRGLSVDLLARATRLAQIPMDSGTESLNVAAAAAICLFEQRRQRSL